MAADTVDADAIAFTMETIVTAVPNNPDDPSAEQPQHRGLNSTPETSFSKSCPPESAPEISRNCRLKC